MPNSSLRGSRLIHIAAALTLFGVGCHTPQPVAPAHRALADAVPKPGLIEVADMLEITIRDVPSRVPYLAMRVGPDRSIHLPLGLTLIAAGKTTSALAEDVRAAYVPAYFVYMQVQITNMGPAWSPPRHEN